MGALLLVLECFKMLQGLGILDLYTTLAHLLLLCLRFGVFSQPYVGLGIEAFES